MLGKGEVEGSDIKWKSKKSFEKVYEIRYIICKEMGFGGYFVHSRTGLITKYLGEKWFSLVRSCVKYGKHLGMETWLYDEDRWPCDKDCSMFR